MRTWMLEKIAGSLMLYADLIDEPLRRGDHQLSAGDQIMAKAIVCDLLATKEKLLKLKTSLDDPPTPTRLRPQDETANR